MKLRIFFLTVATSVLFISCSTGPAVFNPDSLVIFPAPPDAPRIQFLMKISSAEDIGGGRSEFLRMLLGENESDYVLKPYGISLQSGKMYLCDTKLNNVIIIDFEEEEFSYFISGGMGKLKKPINLHCDTLGRLFVADIARGEVVVFDKELDFLQAIAPDDGGKPVDVCIAEGKLWILDLGRRQVYAHDPVTFERLFAFPDTSGEEEQRLFSPTNIAVRDGKVVVSDLGTTKLKIYDTSGKHLQNMGSIGQKPGQFVRPKGVAVDPEGTIYIVDAAFQNVQMFNSTGEFLMPFGGPYKGPGYMYMPAQVFVDTEHLEYFRKYVDPRFDLKYLIFVTNQFGPDKISVYGRIELRGASGETE
jgi:sugar lactone lactonase YvrE